MKQETSPHETPRMKTAVILFNLGGPDALASVEPFLFNLFRDEAIIGLPNPLRRWIAKLISRRRAPVARHIYAQMGGRSPILELTEAQAKKLEEKLNLPPFPIGGGSGWGHSSAAGENNAPHFSSPLWEGETRKTFPPAIHYRVFTSMRYWHPFSHQVAREVKAYAPDRILLLPLYPQFSTATTGSSLKDWKRAARKAGLALPTEALCCYPTDPHFIASHAAQLLKTYDEALLKGTPRILFSAHGLPEKIIRRGDPYQWQVEQTAAAILEAAFGANPLPPCGGGSGWGGVEVVRQTAAPPPPNPLPQGEGGYSLPDHVICYQSRVGPMQWIGPSTESEIIRAAEEHLPIVVVPVAFVSEHSETLVELDIEYRTLAEKHGSSNYFRVPALGLDDWFIDALAEMARGAFGGSALASDSQIGYAGTHSHCGRRICPKQFGKCAMKE